ncbi:peptidase M16 [Fervidicella metallireducens AeB]|uniref:Peptidase M16 n=1 Tax=Fervidicella metallireducens AeB TaxID=1403537 RepID=A0A017RYB2_9CLOT|nr:insulinase family protein [Fervidicella metallireducens]EYE89773.1 peptidase M16 [Fervidicella metallireducens AeB]
MNLELNKIYHGFRLLEEKDLKEINSTARLFSHEKSGARLLYISNDDDNKVFSISFRTPPENSTGLPHILEHSVLCGSRKFPVKEPFVELVKGSLNTFLNAMTYPDKTMYPVASKNSKDFINLMDVYLDAVFYPNIYECPEILMQEGWHYEIDNKDSDIEYKGVVYNEMKGAFSSPEGILFRKIQESLFPDTTYGFESGGDPDVIPELTQEEFLNFHRTYYHPSNSYIFLYGDGDILEHLKFINEEYLDAFNKIDINSKIPEQKPIGSLKEMTVEYSISNDEEEKDKTFLSLNTVVGKATDPELYLAFEILEHMLLSTPAAPLKKALLDAGIGKDVFGVFDNSILQPVFSVVVKNSNEDRKDEFVEIVNSTLRDIVQNGLDKKLIEASINIKEFQMREANFNGYPKGLIYGIKCMDSWLYDENPYMHLQYEDTLKKIKTALTSNYFEVLIEKYLLNSSHSSLLIVKPECGLSEKKAEEVKNKLRGFKEGLSESEIEELINNTIKLRERQETPDSEEELERIPLISLEDIEKNVEGLPTEKRKELGIDVLHHEMFTNNIAYINMYFDTTSVERELIPYVGLLSGILGKVNTETYSYQDLTKEININTGGIENKVEIFGEKGSFEIFHPKFIVKSKVLVDKLPRLLQILREITCASKFDDKKRIKEIIQETKSRIEMSIINNGNVTAVNRVYSYIAASGKYYDLVKGVAYFKFLSELERDFDKRADEICNNIERTFNSIFNINNIVIGITCDEAGYNRFRDNLEIIQKGLRTESPSYQKYDFSLEHKNDGLMTSAKVQYVAKAYNFRKLGYEYTGRLYVLKTILSYDYFWNKIRVQGGAYGCGLSFDRFGKIACSSYRDPNLIETIKVYDETYKYLQQFNVNEREMRKYIIGTISMVDTPLTPSMKGERADAYYFSKVTLEDIQKEREEILSTTPKDVNNLSGLIRDCMNQNYVCVLGNEEKIKENRDIFNELINIFQ